MRTPGRDPFLGRLGILLALAGFAAGCGNEPGTPGEERVGDLADTSYFDGRGKERINAAGETVRFEQFEGRFVWAEYAAPWCPPCEPQAAAVKHAARAASADVVFLTIMTSDMGGYGDPATRATAERWAGRHGLDPRRVLAADLTAISVPRHILFSPRGQMLFMRTGSMSSDEIETVVARRAADWKRGS